MRTLASLFILALFTMAAGADTLQLKNGSSVDGTYLGGDSREVRFLGSNGSAKSYSLNDVWRISFGSAASESITSPNPAPSPASSRSAAAAAAPAPRYSVPAGTVVNVRMIDSIDSDVNGVGERFRASLDEALVVNGREVAPKGADAVVQVARVEQSGVVSGKDEVAVELAAIIINGREYSVNSNYAEVASKGKTGQTAKTAGGGAALGAIIGAIAGGGKGAAIGAGVGAGAGTVYSATRGEKVRIPSETLLMFALRDDLSY
jgi:outer membrane lipoprotein SlyB